MQTKISLQCRRFQQSQWQLAYVPMSVIIFSQLQYNLLQHELKYSITYQLVRNYEARQKFVIKGSVDLKCKEN